MVNEDEFTVIEMAQKELLVQNYSYKSYLWANEKNITQSIHIPVPGNACTLQWMSYLNQLYISWGYPVIEDHCHHDDDGYEVLDFVQLSYAYTVVPAF